MSKNKLVVITGASSGIGEATAKLFAQKGYKLLLLARRKERLERLVKENEYFNEENTVIHQCDVNNVEDIRAGVNLATKKFDLPVDCFINNAGIAGKGSSLADHELDNQYGILDTNIKGVLNGINVVAKEMANRQSGTIINVSSVVGRKPIPGAAVYSASKFAVHALSETLRSELASSKVRVVVIAPGITESEIADTDVNVKEMVEGLKKGLTLGVLKSEDVAESILFAYQAPPHVCLREIVLAPTEQSF